MLKWEMMNKLPEIQRARMWRLYAADGRRFVDLWQDGGHALLGHNPPGMLGSLKNEGQRGLFSPMPHSSAKWLLKALAVLLPDVPCFRLYIGSAFCTPPVKIRWFPFTPPPVNAGNLQEDITFSPVLPLPLRGGLEVAACTESAAARLPPSQNISPLFAVAATRLIYDLIAAKRKGRFNPPYSVLYSALKTNKSWTREGIYLHPGNSARAAYAGIYSRFLDAGFLLPPDTNDPVILPGELSPGEEARLAALFSDS